MFIKKTMYLLLLTGFFITYLTSADVVTKVLQNGTEGYTGCKDSYNYSSSPDQNNADWEHVFNHNCQN